MNHAELLDAERELETDAVERARERYRAAVAKGALADSAPGAQLIARSIGAVIAAIEAWQADATSGKAGRGIGLAKFLSQYDADEVAFLTLRHCVTAAQRSDRLLSTVATDIVADLEAIDLEARLKAADMRAYMRYVRAAANWRGKTDRQLAILKKQSKYVGTFGEKARFAWTPSERLQVGVRLVEIVAEHTDLIQIEFTSHPMDLGKNDKTGYYILPTQNAADWIEKAHAFCEIARPVLYPMVVPPLPWRGNTGGGYLSDKPGFRRPLIKGVPGGYRQDMRDVEMPLVTEAVNALQETAWAINTRVLEVLARNLDSGHSLTGLPNDFEALTLPERHDFMDTKDAATWTEEEKALFKRWKKETREIKAKRNLQRAYRGTVEAQRRIAERMAKYPAIYFPHQLDFRGRAYPMASFVHPQGDDVAKGLLSFARSLPLGEDGLRWLAIHGANSFGVDKVSFEERQAWVVEHSAEIVLDARDPYRSDALWVKADSPFVFLAFAFEWSDLVAWVNAGRRPEDFESRLPVGLDGSCNGLQHFSAMLRDPIGGAATNLVPADRPADIYSIVAEEVRKRVEFDLASDDTDTRTFAEFWTDVGITRKWTKRNTMTLPYGVSKFGMKDQIWSEIGAGNAAEFFGEDGLERGAAVRYLAEQNWNAIGKVVVAARQAMDWLRAAAKVASDVVVPGSPVKGLPLLWTTPDGLPIQQRYVVRERIKVALYGGKYNLVLRPHSDKLDSMRQQSGIAPNFVHSVDATHMRMVVRRLRAEGVTDFAMIHDSFGTHAGNVERLARVTREEFVELHKTDLLARFRDELAAALPADVELPPLPPHGDLDLDVVKDSPYFFA